MKRNGAAFSVVWLAVACSGEIGGSDQPAAPTTIDADGNLVDGNGMIVTPGPANTGDGMGGPSLNPTADPSNSVPSPGTSEQPNPNGSVPTPPPSNPDTSRPFVDPVPDTAALEARAWRLTHEEYAKSVEAFLGATVDTSSFAIEIENGTFTNMSSAGFVGNQLAEDYFDTAESVVSGLSEAQVAAFSPSGMLNAAALDGFLNNVIKQAFRRPPRSQDLERFRGIFEAATDPADPSLGFRMVLKGLLTSPYFVYRTEIGPVGSAEPVPGETFALTDHEIASFLSYSVLGLPPSEGELAAADRSEYSTALLSDHIQALLDSPEASTRLATFVSEWLEIDRFEDVHKFEEVFPGFDLVKADMERERDAFFAQSGTMTSGSVRSLLTDPVPEVTAPLTEFYLSDGSALGTDERLGILGLGTVLSARAKEYLTSPTTRGLFIRDRLLCQTITLPPDFTPEPITAVQEREQPDTTRELYMVHLNEPSCATCHELIDPLGFTLEGFDGAGRLRSKENGFDVDSSGYLTGSDVDRELRGAADLSRALAESQWTHECMAIQAYRFYNGAYEPSRGAQPLLDARVAMGPNGQLGPMIAALLASPDAYLRVRETATP